MKTVKTFRSPFCLFIVLVLFGCTQQSGRRQKSPNADKLAVLLDQLQDSTYTTSERLSFANEAYTLAATSKKDTLIGKAFNAKSGLLAQIYPDSSFRFLENYTKQARARNDGLNLGNGYSLLAEHYLSISDDQNAFQYLNAAKNVYETRKDSQQVAYKLLQMAEIYKQYTDYIELERVSAEALRFSKHIEDDTAYSQIIYNNLGIAAKGLYNYNDAIKYYNHTVAIAPDSLAKSIALNNIAVVHTLSGNPQRAINILDTLYHSKTVNEHPLTKARITCNLGYATFKKKPLAGISLLTASEADRLAIADSSGLVSTWIHLAEAYTVLSPPLAKDYARKAYHTATGLHSPDDRMEALYYLIEATADGEHTRFYSLKYIQIKDSIQKVRQTARNQFAKIRYDSRKEKEENFRLKADRIEKALALEKRKRINAILYIVSGFLLVFLFMIVYFLKKKHKQDKIFEGIKGEERVARKVHDELANDLFNAMTFADTQDLSDAGKKEMLINNLEHAYTRSRDIAHENSPVDAGAHFPEHLRTMILHYNSDNMSVIIRGMDDIPWELLSDNKKQSTWRIIQELMINMKKHSQADVAALRFTCNGKIVKINYSDNGVGMAFQGKKNKTGLQNVENRIDTMGGTIIFDSGSSKGIKIEMAYPVKN